MRLFLEIAFKNLYKFITQKNYFTFYLLLLKYGDKKRHQQKIVKFYHYDLRVADHLSFIFQFKEIFIEESYKFISNQKNPVIVDCGSNIGMSVLYYKSLFPESKITCIEADPSIANILVENLNRNLIIDVEVIKKAAWINNDGVSFSSDGADGGTINENSTNKIESIDFNELLRGYTHIDFLKIDIEGAEKVLIPYCMNSISVAENIFLEYHTNYNDVQNLGLILDSFTKKGYKYFIKNENKRNSPFANKMQNNAFDMQLNIFLYKS